MNPMPPTDAIPTAPLFVNGYLELAMLVSVVSLFVVFAMLLWAARADRRQRAAVNCPLRMRPTSVVFRLAPTGARADVVRCEVFGRGPVTCGKACLPRTAFV